MERGDGWWDAVLDELEGSLADAARLVADAAAAPARPWSPPAAVPGPPTAVQKARAEALLRALQERRAELVAARAAAGAALAEVGGRRVAGQAYRLYGGSAAG